MRIADVNPRRITDFANSNHKKYFALNNIINDRKPIATVNPINHEITYSK